MRLNTIKSRFSPRCTFRNLALMFVVVQVLVSMPAPAVNAFDKCTAESKSLWAADNLWLGWKKANEKKEQRIKDCLAKLNDKKDSKVPTEVLVSR